LRGLLSLAGVVLQEALVMSHVKFVPKAIRVLDYLFEVVLESAVLLKRCSNLILVLACLNFLLEKTAIESFN
jgi:hypothetical protein